MIIIDQSAGLHRANWLLYWTSDTAGWTATKRRDWGLSKSAILWQSKWSIQLKRSSNNWDWIMVSTLLAQGYPMDILKLSTSIQLDVLWMFTGYTNVLSYGRQTWISIGRPNGTFIGWMKWTSMGYLKLTSIGCFILVTPLYYIGPNGRPLDVYF